MTGQYGAGRGIFTSLPCVIGAEGVEEVYTLDLSEHEFEGFHKSCQHIRDNIAQLDWWDEGRLGRQVVVDSPPSRDERHHDDPARSPEGRSARTRR